MFEVVHSCHIPDLHEWEINLIFCRTCWWGSAIRSIRCVEQKHIYHMNDWRYLRRNSFKSYIREMIQWTFHFLLALKFKAKWSLQGQELCGHHCYLRAMTEVIWGTRTSKWPTVQKVLLPLLFWHHIWDETVWTLPQERNKQLTADPHSTAAFTGSN